MRAFAVDPAFDAGSAAAAEWPLCHVRLQNDARFPWLILIPRRAGLVELEDLTGEEQALLMQEVVAAGRTVRDLAAQVGWPVEKLNVATLGNVTRQLHVHVVGRRRRDGLWPDPVWGRGSPRAYGAAELEKGLAIVRLSRGG